jgi:hypothetical protein
MHVSGRRDNYHNYMCYLAIIASFNGLLIWVALVLGELEVVSVASELGHRNVNESCCCSARVFLKQCTCDDGSLRLRLSQNDRLHIYKSK